jgi:hypothetical protein
MAITALDAHRAGRRHQASEAQTLIEPALAIELAHREARLAVDPEHWELLDQLATEIAHREQTRRPLLAMIWRRQAKHPDQAPRRQPRCAVSTSRSTPSAVASTILGGTSASLRRRGPAAR